MRLSRTASTALVAALVGFTAVVAFALAAPLGDRNSSTEEASTLDTGTGRASDSAGSVDSKVVSQPRNPQAPDVGPPGEDLDFVVDGRFEETFDGRPSKPEPFDSPAWTINVSSRNPDTWERLDPMHAHHGPGCEPPLATHVVTEYARSVYRCRDHVMTAINAEGYGLIYLAPHALVDLRDGEAVVRFDVSTFRSSGRDWIDLWVTGYDDQLALPFNPGEGDVDLQGAPLNAVHFEMDRGCSGFRFSWYRDGRQHSDSPGCWGLADWNEVLIPDASRRDTIELRISKNYVQLWMPDYNFTLAEGPVNLGFDLGVVQLGHHSYNPTKDCRTANSPMDADDCAPTTWHWDNVIIEPALPVTVGSGSRRVAWDENDRVFFSHVAPKDTHLRFSAVGTVEVSFDRGRTWQLAEKQESVLKGAYHPEHASSYWIPVPEGATSVQFRFGEDEWYRGPFHARDFSIWTAPAP